MFAFGLFLTSLTDYYVKILSGAPLPVLGVAILAFQCRRFHRLRGLELAYIMVMAVALIVGFYRLWTDVTVEGKVTNTIGWIVCFAALLIDLDSRSDKIENAIQIFLMIHVGFFFLQGAVYVASGFYIDPVLYVTGEPSRYMGGTLTDEIAFFSMRPTGFFEEPSNYAVHVLPMAWLYYLRTKKISPLVALTVVSSALTFSSWAFVAVAGSTLMLVGRSRKALMLSLAAWVSVYVFVSAFSEWFIKRTFETRYESGLTPAELRHEFAKAVFENVLLLSPGLGIGVHKPGILFYAINDSGALLYLFYVFGIFAFFLLVPLFFSTNGWRNKFLLALLFTSKLGATYPLFWILINLLSRQPKLEEMLDQESHEQPPQSLRPAESLGGGLRWLRR